MLHPGEVQAVRRGTAPRLSTHPGLPGNHHWQRPPKVGCNYNHQQKLTSTFEVSFDQQQQ